MSSIRIEEVEFSYQPEKIILKSLSCSWDAGSIHSIMGINGSGKSTLLSLALGWLKPKSGNIFLKERNLQEYDRRTLGQTIAIVSQNEHIPFHFSVLDFLLLGRAPYLPSLSQPVKSDYNLAKDLLHQFELESLLYRSIQGLSAGEVQMLSILRALMQEPEILLLDEPSSHLDPTNTERLAEILLNLKTNGLTIVFSTHDYLLAQQLSDTTLLLGKGEAIATGRTDDVVSEENLFKVYGSEFIEKDKIPRNYFIPAWLKNR